MSILKLVDVTKSFGGLKAVHNLSLEVNEGDILGLIGPNGAGKTTVFNLITGFLHPENGDIIFNGHSLLELKPHAICKLGITRSFQIAKPFSALTVLQSVMVGAFHLTKEADHAKTEALKILDSLRLTHLGDMKTRSLTLSDRKRVDRPIVSSCVLSGSREGIGGASPVPAYRRTPTDGPSRKERTTWYKAQTRS